MYQFDHPQVLTLTVLTVEQVQAVYAVLADPKYAPKVKAFDYIGNGSANNALGQIMPELRPDFAQTSEPSDTYNEFAERYALAESAEQGGVSETAELDVDGLPFDPATMTGTKLKNGQWRMKNGVERPAVAAAQTPSEMSQSAEAVGEADASDVQESSASEDDEFAAFREAAAASEEAPAEVQVPARTWTDADLGALCNQAATKLGDPAPIKAIIASFVPEGEVPHSRNIPADKREDFAQAIEAKAEIEFAG